MRPGVAQLSSALALSAFVQQVFGCSPETARAIAFRAVERRFSARSLVLRQGDLAEEAWLVVKGRAQSVVYGADGQVVQLLEFGEGELFGAIAGFEAEPQPADVEALEDLRVAVFSAPDFLALIQTHGVVGLAVTRSLLRQLRQTTGRMVERSTLSAAGRVHAELLRMASPDPDGRLLIRPVPVLASLAVRIHSTRETVSRTISTLERRGILLRTESALEIVAPRRLREMLV